MDFLSVLERFQNVRPNGRGWTAICPAHDDNNNSLSLKISDKGWMLTNCFAGCSRQAILKAAGLTWKDVAPEQIAGETRQRTIEAVYNYRDASGRLRYRKNRYFPKDFRIIHPTATGGWNWGMGDSPALLYRLPELVHQRPETVWVVEGEKDCDALRRLGHHATSPPNGSGSDWPPEWSSLFRHCAAVLVCADDDGPGRRFAERVLGSLLCHGIPAAPVEIPAVNDTAKDIGDILAHCRLNEIDPQTYLGAMAETRPLAPARLWWGGEV